MDNALERDLRLLVAEMRQQNWFAASRHHAFCAEIAQKWAARLETIVRAATAEPQKG